MNKTKCENPNKPEGLEHEFRNINRWSLILSSA